MNPLTADRFAEFYLAVYGYEPFPWQVRLATQVCGGGEWPRAIALPTAAGKTTCLDIAVFALACRAKGAARRIFFVVDRRIVVDQAQIHASRLAKVLAEAKKGILKEVADALKELGQSDRPLDVYALRGGMYRETAWVRSPLQPTVIASTVDQVGSRLLFRGYGVSDSMKPVHAALVGNDALILLDEAHCAKPFQQTAEAVERYRGWNESLAPFRFVSITATPTEDVRAAEEKRAEERPDDPKLIEEANDEDRGHPVLGIRISAKKRTRLVRAKKNELIGTLKSEAEALMGVDLGETTDKDGNVTRHVVQAVGIIVNRVKTARQLAQQLRTPPKAKKGEAPPPAPKVILLTGRMRPVDRDAILRELEPLFSNSKKTLERPVYVVATQCLEVGADLDFHALVTECASLDALRQRFGRLNRVAVRPSAPAVVVCPEEYAEPKEKEKEQDPVYRNSLPHAWKWLHDFADGKDEKDIPFIDFGVASIEKKWNGTSADRKLEVVKQSLDAPVLFPAHLDCWVQTHPIPTPDPDVALWLHGPKEGGQPDVQVVFRDDLPADNTAIWKDIVALCPPSSSEAVAVPLSVFKKWLAGETRDTDTTGDVEGAEADDTENLEASDRFALCWKGADNDDTEVISDPDDVWPTRTYVVRCQGADVHTLADFIALPPADYAEEAFQRSRDKALLRLAVTLTEEQSDEEQIELVSDAILARLMEGAPEWLKRAVKALEKPKARLVAKHPNGGVIVTGRRRLMQFDPEFLDEDASSYSPGRREVTLEAHSRGVAAHAARFAAGCGLNETLYTQAGFLHDLGKLDPRFQKMLAGYVRKEPLAKSGTFAQRAWELHRYPKGARHELLSAALLADRADDELLHLIATHHGSARPFASAVEENDAAKPFDVPPQFGLDIRGFSPEQRIADWNPELAERFWRQVRKHGWWGSAFREAVFRLADHAQSRAEQESEEAAEAKAADVSPPPLTPRSEPQRLYPLPLPGLDGSNPLAFLAALGTLRVADRAFGGAKLSWRFDGCWSPVLHLPREVSPDDLASAMLAAAPKDRRCLTFAEDVKALMGPFCAAQRDAAGIARDGREFADFLAAYADPLVTVQGGPNAGRTKPTEFYFVAGQQKLLELAGTIAERALSGHLTKALFETWRYDDATEKQALRWDPLDDSRYATRWRNPSGDPARKKSGSVLGANRLAFEALPFFPCVARGDRLATTGFVALRRRPFFVWPLWAAELGPDAARSLLALVKPPKQSDEEESISPPRGLGVSAWYRCEKVPNSDYSNFTPSQTL